ncbi:DUF1801 domain-containing protein [Candidatus Saccharibacteria bacterium]|nr:MAG: DUF1801 domain-containing protein [Candidatus Saccharibacteria bacterium]
MAENKTKPTVVNPASFLAGVSNATRREDGAKLLDIMQEITGQDPVMWGPSMIGFGSYHYKGRSSEGDWLRVGFSPRSSALVLYGLVFYDENEPNNHLLSTLGKYTRGKGCLYVKSLADVDELVLRKMIKNAYFHEATNET